MNLRKYTLEQLKEAISTSSSLRQTLEKLGVAAAGGNYQTMSKAIKHFNIDISHFTGQLWNKGKTIGPKRDIQDYLSNNQTITTYKLKNRLIKEGIFKHKCDCCNKTKWMSKPIALELHHKDGNNKNNSLDNLELLCPNCHAFTDNYRGKNQDRAK
jgi:hypothetical protein